MAKITSCPRVIAFVGPMGSGKTTCAKIMRELLRGKIISFATPIKKMAEAANIPHENIYGTPEQKAQPLDILCGKSSRQFQQLLGTDFAREMIGQDFWLKQFEHAVWSAETEYVFCDDLRFINEAALIRKLGGTIVRVIHGAPVSSAEQHVSETEQASIREDWSLFSPGTLTELRFALGHLVRKLGLEAGH